MLSSTPSFICFPFCSVLFMGGLPFLTSLVSSDPINFLFSLFSWKPQDTVRGDMDIPSLLTWYSCRFDSCTVVSLDSEQTSKKRIHTEHGRCPAALLLEFGKDMFYKHQCSTTGMKNTPAFFDITCQVAKREQLCVVFIRMKDVLSGLSVKSSLHLCDCPVSHLSDGKEGWCSRTRHNTIQQQQGGEDRHPSLRDESTRRMDDDDEASLIRHW